MAIAIKGLTAEHAYKDLTAHFSDKGRLGKIVSCPTCGAEHVLYYGQELQEGEATTWLQGLLPAVCPSHVGWLCLNEATPVSAEEHRQRVERAISALKGDMDVEDEAATRHSGRERERLILSSARKEAEMNELKQELES